MAQPQLCPCSFVRRLTSSQRDRNSSATLPFGLLPLGLPCCTYRSTSLRCCEDTPTRARVHWRSRTVGGTNTRTGGYDARSGTSNRGVKSNGFNFCLDSPTSLLPLHIGGLYMYPTTRCIYRSHSLPTVQLGGFSRLYAQSRTVRQFDPAVSTKESRLKLRQPSLYSTLWLNDRRGEVGKKGRYPAGGKTLAVRVRPE